MRSGGSLLHLLLLLFWGDFALCITELILADSCECGGGEGSGRLFPHRCICLPLSTYNWAKVEFPKSSSLYPDDGNCFQFHRNLKQCGKPVDLFFYNILKKRCETFVDYGCPGRLNRYISMEQCLEYCDPKSKPSCRVGRSQGWGPGGQAEQWQGSSGGRGGLLSPCGKRPNPALHSFF
ncbi:kunitz-type protease inhibitor 4 [Crotalus adamanteus]|uniref:Kunitz-type protease inhibitor 4 n=1 Tax=Crotalus adamanteus TaxID=8729 RepID=A0AAW1BSE2_CROAD